MSKHRQHWNCSMERKYFSTKKLAIRIKSNLFFCSALISLLKFLQNCESQLAKHRDLFQLASRIINIFNLFITFSRFRCLSIHWLSLSNISICVRNERNQSMSFDIDDEILCLLFIVFAYCYVIRNKNNRSMSICKWKLAAVFERFSSNILSKSRNFVINYSTHKSIHSMNYSKPIWHTVIPNDNCI